jgi:hypothetical protein
MSAIQKVTSEKEQIPKYYVALSSYGCHNGDRKATPEYRALNDAWQKKALGGWKLMSTPSDLRGRIYIDPNEAAAILKALDAAKVTAAEEAASQQVPQSSRAEADPALLECGFSIHSSINRLVAVAERIVHALERTAEAVESIATQPKQPVGSWRDMNGDVMD